MNVGGQSDVGCAANLSISMFYETGMHIVGSRFTSLRFFPIHVNWTHLSHHLVFKPQRAQMMQLFFL